MASFVYTVFSIASVHCAVRPEISPCTCEPMYATNHVALSCEKVDSFHQIVDVLSNKFKPYVNIHLKITHSQLEDLEMRSFTDMNLNVVKLRMQWNSLRSMPELPFRGLSRVEYLSIGDNELEEIPKHVLNHMPIMKTLDIGRCRIRSVQQDDLKGIQMVTNLILPSNNITRLDKGAFPPSLITLHLGRNQIESLNGTLRDLNKLESLFINANSINELDEELPESNMLKLIMAHNNRLERLPESMRSMNKLETVHLQFNRLKSFDGMLKNAEYLNELFAYNNEIEYLAHDEFQKCHQLEQLNLACNHIKSVNSSLLPMMKLISANFSFNDIEEFAMDELYGLRSLKQLDLSNNRIHRLRPSHKDTHDLVLIEMKLDHNHIVTLDSALMSLSSLRILSLPYNRIQHILPGDFDDMERLEILDLTGNQLTDLTAMEKTNLPSLKVLKVAYNKIAKLDKDFHGLPVLCQVNLTNNQISSISSELVSKTRCKNHNVPGKLELHLDDNPIMCDERLNELCTIMLAQEARIRGRSQCFENDQEVCTVLPMLFTPIKIDNLPIIIQQKLKNSEQTNGKPVVQVIMPSPIIIKNNGDELLPPLIATLGQPLINPLIITPSLVATTTTVQPATLPPNSDEATTTPPAAAALNASVPNAEMATTTAPTMTTTTTMMTTTTTSTTTTTTTEIPPVLLNIEPLNVSNAEPTGATSRNVHDVHELQMAIEIPPNVVAVATAATATASSPVVPPPPEAAAEPGVATKTEYETVEYIPNLVNPSPPEASEETAQNNAVILDEDSQSNSVHEEYPSVVLTDLEHSSQSLQLPEEPPENP